MPAPGRPARNRHRPRDAGRRVLLGRGVAALAFAAGPALAAAQSLTVSAASSLADAFREIGARFEAARPGVTVRFNVGASGVLLQQVLQGAPVDVFASADQASMDRGLAEGALDPATRIDVARNALVLITPMQGAPRIGALSDLRDPAVRRVALGKPATVPAGRYTKQVLEAAGLWEAVEPRMVFADNVRQVLDYVARGEVEAGFVYRTDAALARDRVRVVLTATGHTPIVYPAAVVVGSRRAALARDFLAFVQADASRAILARHGFGNPPPGER